ncbi:MAG: Type I restriction-modification system restriction subunit [uncultured bacterium (gcode 4)]|uniref:Type I restriction enzyme endonuclease subunit n=1 Tax=uncultured bacterium (gcode 4) TaxID=1234023 RepID=K1XGU0_9BACT|nr:MAG: Type I restriction-modification system restriction subunit [uncultured bacterium (gcode 4)]
MLNESHVEQNLIDMLVAQGYEYFYGPDIAPYSTNPQREGFDSVVLENHLKESIHKLNPDVPESARVEAYNHVLRLGSNDIMTNNEKFHTMLTDGVTVEYFKNGQTKGINVKLIDIEKIDKNSFWVVNQLVVKENNTEKRMDVVIFVNGLPLVVIELKNATDEKATLDKAFTQIQNYKKAIPSIFFYNALCVISDGIDAKVSSVSAPFSRYLSWKSPKKEENGLFIEMKIMTEYMLDKEVLLKLIRYNTVFETEEVKDAKTGILSVVKVKKVAAYHQYYAVEKAVNETLKATHETEGDRKIGVVRHTQGSGKSLSMVFYTGQIVVQPEMKNPTVVILTDRNDLDDQLFWTFWNCVGLLRQKPVQAEDRDHLKELLKVAGGWIVFTTIQKFYSKKWENIFEKLSDRTNIVVVADEAHRSQYWFKGREVETKEGSEIRYGNAKYLRDALPKASFIGFTGTPIEKEDKDTTKIFGDYVDIYDIKQAVEDGATVPISYESRLVKIKMDKKAVEKIDTLVNEIEGASEEQKEKAKKRNAQIDAIVWHPDRLKDISKDIVEHFEARQEIFEGKAMIVCMTRQIAVNLYDQIIKLRPDWHNDELMKGGIKIVMTSSSDDPESFQPHHTSKEDRKKLAIRLKDVHDPLKMVIVQSMWLTGFDVPCLHTMYIDKKMQGANLMQAIARVNRVYKDKPGGLIVDYIGIGQDLKNAMAVYTQSWGEGKAVLEIADIIAGMKTKFEIVEQMFYGYDYKKYFKAPSKDKLQILLWASNFILGDEKLKNRFLAEITALSKLFAMAVPTYEAESIRDQIAFFQAVKARINKFTPWSGKTDKEVETAIKQIMDEALSSGGVIDIFEAAGMKAPSLDILSEEFLLEVKNMKHENLAFELLKKLLNDEVKLRKRKNMTQGKKFSEMLENVIKRYHNNQIDTAQVIQELSDIAREMKLEDHKAEEIWLTPEEYAFYSVLAQNKSTKFLEDDKMKELIHVIVDIIRKNTTVDWDKRDDVKAKLRLTVKKILMRYGYPPDLARIEADKVLEQSELLASELTRE